MQHGVGCRHDAFGAHVAGGRAEEGEQFGSASSLILMGLSGGMAFGLP